MVLWCAVNFLNGWSIFHQIVIFQVPRCSLRWSLREARRRTWRRTLAPPPCSPVGLGIMSKIIRWVYFCIFLYLFIFLYLCIILWFWIFCIYVLITANLCSTSVPSCRIRNNVVDNLVRWEWYKQQRFYHTFVAILCDKHHKIPVLTNVSLLLSICKVGND